MPTDKATRADASDPIVKVKLTKGQQLALYVLLSTRSQMRFSMEGIIGNDYGMPGPGPVMSQQDIDNRLDYQLTNRFANNLDHTSLSNSSLLLPSGSATECKSGGVTLDGKRLRAAIGLDKVYDPASDPCPSDFSKVSGAQVQTNDQAHIITALSQLT